MGARSPPAPVPAPSPAATSSAGTVSFTVAVAWPNCAAASSVGATPEPDVSMSTRSSSGAARAAAARAIAPPASAGDAVAQPRSDAFILQRARTSGGHQQVEQGGAAWASVRHLVGFVFQICSLFNISRSKLVKAGQSRSILKGIFRIT